MRVVHNTNDSIIVLKYTKQNCTIHFIFCYLPPENSVFYTSNNTDLFQSLEETLVKYNNEGSVYVLGDLNSRTGVRHDFIENDIPNNDLLDKLESFNYNSDVNLEIRSNMDEYVNSFGRRLLSLCKASGLRIVNGRHEGDRDGSFTFYSKNGKSTIDYLLTSIENFNDISRFQIMHQSLLEYV